MPEKEESGLHGAALLRLQLGRRQEQRRVKLFRVLVAQFLFDFLEVLVGKAAEIASRTIRKMYRLVLVAVLFGGQALDVLILCDRTQRNGQIVLQIRKRRGQQVGRDLSAVLGRVHVAQSGDLGCDVRGQTERELTGREPRVVWAAPGGVQVVCLHVVTRTKFERHSCCGNDLSNVKRHFPSE